MLSPSHDVDYLSDCSLYAELRPLSSQRSLVDHLYLLRDNGRLTRTGESIFSSPFYEIALAYHDGADRYSALKSQPRFGRRPRRGPFHGWMLGLRIRPGRTFDREQLSLESFGDIFLRCLRTGNPLDNSLHALDEWIERNRGRLSSQDADEEVVHATISKLPLVGGDADPVGKIGRLAAAAGVSPRTLQRQVRARTGLPPKRYATLQRFDSALRMLVSDDGSLPDIAADLGYSDQAHMTADLTRHAGVSPARFRAVARAKMSAEPVRIFKDQALQDRLQMLVRDDVAS